MGNQSSALGDDDHGGILTHFDHTFKGFLHTTCGEYFAVFGSLMRAHEAIQLNCNADTIEIIGDALVASERKKCSISYEQIAEIGWDHSLGEVKFTMSRDIPQFVIIQVPTSVELEYEIKQRFRTLTHETPSLKIPSFMYVGMFTGATKPKPFQRKRPNLSKVPADKLPQLSTMREIAIRRHRTTYAPCPPGISRRINLALEHIYEGSNNFAISSIQSPGDVPYGQYQNSWSVISQLSITEKKLVYYPQGTSKSGEEIPFDWLSFWITEENETELTKNGIRFYFSADSNLGLGEVFFGFPFIRDVKHTFEFFWNKYQISKGLPVMLGSTHGRPVETIHTLSGEIPAPPTPPGQIDIVDTDGMVIRPGSLVKQGSRSSISLSPSKRDSLRRASSLNTLSFQSDVVPLPRETKVKNHWRAVVKHQGWLLKKGGVGLKQWIKRYFVLYSTSQGHFLVYYSDVLECPMYTTERLQRNIIDLSKTTFIRPGTSRDDQNNLPPFTFDIQTIEREWILCAESQDNVYKWLQILTRAIDEDAAIIPDEVFEFDTKAKRDPTGFCNPNDYSSQLKISAYAVNLFVPEYPGSLTSRLAFSWIFTDFFKWSIVTQNGKLALQLSVFSDGTFQGKDEFIFRTKDALRLAATVEYFIEKFMVTMHLQLEDEYANLEASVKHSSEPGDDLSERKLPHATLDQWQADQGSADDLLGFGSDDLGLPSSPDPHMTQSISLSSGIPAWNSDPFGFTSPPPPSSLSPSYVPLTSSQIEQHHLWYSSLISTGNGNFYDDGVLHITCSVEIRGSQGRITLSYQNTSKSETLATLNVSLSDAAGLLRSQVAPIQTHLIPQEQILQHIMVECLQPVIPGPSLTISYTCTLGFVKNTLLLPLTVLSFNDPLPLNLPDFHSRWGMLTHPGQEVIEIFHPRQLVTSEVISRIAQSTFKFYRIENSEGKSILGAASLRTGAINPQTGEKVTLGCLLKVDHDKPTNALRVICRSVLPAAATAIIQTVKSLLS